MMRMKFTLFLCLSIALSTFVCSVEKENHPVLKLEPKTQEESLFLRRIIEFWEEESYELVESQVLSFVKQFPTSQLNDSLHALLGDLYVFRKEYGRALNAYSKIVSNSIQEQILLSQLQCLHLTKRYSELTKIAKPFMERFLHSKKDKSLDVVALVANAFYQLAVDTEDKVQVSQYAKEAQTYYERLLQLDRSPLFKS